MIRLECDFFDTVDGIQKPSAAFLVFISRALVVASVRLAGYIVASVRVSAKAR